MTLSDILNRLGEDRDAYFNAMAPPVIQTSNFAFPDVASFRKAFTDEKKAHLYTRGNNPTVEILRKKLAALEETDDALVVSSGAGAMTLAVISCVRAGDHIICVENPYGWTKTLCDTFLDRFGVTTTFVDGRDMAEIEAARRDNTRLLILESPNSFTFSIQDLAACGRWAKEHAILSVIDNSHASPLFQKPARFGIDLVVHTITKYLNGHSDVVGGVICGRQELINNMFSPDYMTLGQVTSAHDAALILRGLRTLPLRMAHVFDTALKVTAYLKAHPLVTEVLYPFDPDFPQYALARQQMDGCGGLVTAYLKAQDLAAVERFIDHLRRFEIAVSWGGHESLVMPMAAFYGIPGKADPILPFTCVRFYCGLEPAEDLIADLDEAFRLL